jgi:hypothetical protein
MDKENATYIYTPSTAPFNFQIQESHTSTNVDKEDTMLGDMCQA